MKQVEQAILAASPLNAILDWSYYRRTAEGELRRLPKVPLPGTPPRASSCMRVTHMIDMSPAPGATRFPDV